MHRRAVLAKPPSVIVLDMWKLLLRLDLLAPAGAVGNVAGALRGREEDMAAVDNVVDRLHRHATADQPAA